jgi:hypothetical protein
VQNRKWPKRISATARWLWLRVRIPPKALIYVSCYCVLSVRCPRGGPIARPEGSYRVSCVCLPEGDTGTSNIRRSRATPVWRGMETKWLVASHCVFYRSPKISFLYYTIIVQWRTGRFGSALLSRNKAGWTRIITFCHTEGQPGAVPCGWAFQHLRWRQAHLDTQFSIC